MQKLTRRHFLGQAAAAGAVVVPSGVLDNAQESYWGDLTGRFVYGGSPPERKKLTVDTDVDCCGKYDIRDESLMVSEDGGLANVYVYMRSRHAPVSVAMAASYPNEVLLDNRECIFMPHCMAIWYLRQSFRIVNSDPIAQNVAFTPRGDLPANIVLSPAPGENTEAVWHFRRSQTTPVLIVCNYHPWESAYILPRDNPYFAISAADGTFTIPGLPVGRWEFQAWHERPEHLETLDWPRGRFTVDIQPGTNDLGTITLPPALFGVS